MSRGHRGTLWLAFVVLTACDYDWDKVPDLGAGGCFTCEEIAAQCQEGGCDITRVCDEAAPALQALTDCACPPCVTECGASCGQSADVTGPCADCLTAAASNMCMSELDACVDP